jgi:protein-S-isoprenylcysteine O-methyltransferase Ste14
MRMPVAGIESFVKSFAFSVVLCLGWGSFSAFSGLALLTKFDVIELLWLVYNATISLLFLIRVRPSVVSMKLSHWVVALVTSFSGFLFSRQVTDDGPRLLFAADTLVVCGIVLGMATALALGRCYDFLPALRGVKTDYVYGIVRHPMYLSSIVAKLGYVLKNPSVYNTCLLAVVAVLYDRRARYEEDVMSHSESYATYLHQVKRRFIPGVY